MDFVVANNGMGLGGTVGPSFGTPNASLGISFSLIFPVGDRKSNINDIVGGRGTASSSGVGPLSFIYGKTFDKNYQPTYNLYGIGISPISSRDIPSPFSIGYSTTPINYQFKIFTWQY